MQRPAKGYVGYDVRLTERAKALRNAATLTEEKLWKYFLRDKANTGYKFNRQKPLSFFIADFYCSKLLLVIEVDGKIHEHRKEYDLQRTQVLNSLGIMVFRISNEDVMNRFELVKKRIKRIIEYRKKVLPLPVKGEGRGEGPDSPSPC